MERANITLTSIFEETEKFINEFNPRKYSPPVIMNTFAPFRERVFKNLMQESRQKSAQELQEIKIAFINKFENEYIETIMDKSKERYIDYIQTKHYNTPEEISFKELKSCGAQIEINQLATSISEWSLMLEVVAYTLEGLKIYGIQEFTGVEKKDYVSILKHGYTFNKKADFQSISEYLVRKLVNFFLTRFSSSSLVGGLKKIEFGSQAIFKIFTMFAVTNRVPWTLMLNYLNLHWVLGGITFSLLLQLLNSYAVKDELISNLKKIFTTFENNKLYLMSQRKKILEIMNAIIKATDHEERHKESKRLTNTVENLLNPNEEDLEIGGITQEESEKMFNIQELDDYVMVEEKDHKEEKDSSGVLVVNF